MSDPSPNTDDSPLAYITIYNATQIDGQENPQLAQQLIDDRTPDNDNPEPEDNGARTSLNSETGFMMRFANTDAHQQLNAFDILTLPDLTSYPVPESAIDSLPATLRAELEQTGFIQLRCIYDNGQMYDAKLGWEETDTIEPPQWFGKLVGEGVSPVAALDYYMVEIAGDGETEENHTVETWAVERNVSKEAINKSIRDVESKLDIDLDQEST